MAITEKRETKFKDTEIGLIPEEWEVEDLGTFASVQGGYAFKSSEFGAVGDVPVVKITNLVPPNIQVEDCQYISSELFNNLGKWALHHKDILISLTGSNVNQMSSVVGKVSRMQYRNKKLALNQRVGRFIVKDKDKLDHDFLYYIVSSDFFKNKIILSAKGSANQANISPSIIQSQKIPVPPLPEQKSIAEILSSLDEKIELNRRMNKTLEEMGKALFKRWFVDFEFPNEDGKPYKSSGGKMVDSELGEIPEGWKVTFLRDY
jgi:type I restriction enzyme S subunit